MCVPLTYTSIGVYVRGINNIMCTRQGTGEFINTYFFCRVCAMVHANARRQRSAHYTDVQAWWRDSACTRTDWRAASREPRSPRDPP